MGTIEAVKCNEEAVAKRWVEDRFPERSLTLGEVRELAMLAGEAVADLEAWRSEFGFDHPDDFDVECGEDEDGDMGPRFVRRLTRQEQAEQYVDRLNPAWVAEVGRKACVDAFTVSVADFIGNLPAEAWAHRDVVTIRLDSIGTSDPIPGAAAHYTVVWR